MFKPLKSAAALFCFVMATPFAACAPPEASDDDDEETGNAMAETTGEPIPNVTSDTGDDPPETGSAANDDTAGETGVPTLAGAVGAPCESDADCPTDGTVTMVCLAENETEPFGGGGPQGGYCSVVCRDADDCAAVDPLSGCSLFDADGNGVCLAICQPGAGAGMIKCGEDRAQVCDPVDTQPGLGICGPRCTSDAGCGDGFCDAGREGLCRPEARAGGGIGAPCTPETEAADCASSLCLQFNLPDAPVPRSFCSGSCTLGSVSGCGFEAGSGTPDTACTTPQNQGSTVGDIGFCFELCDVATDCSQADWICNLFSDAGAELFGRPGSCVPPEVIAPSEVDSPFGFRSEVTTNGGSPSASFDLRSMESDLLVSDVPNVSATR